MPIAVTLSSRDGICCYLPLTYRHFRFTSICQRPCWHLPIVSFIFRAAYILQDKYLSQLKVRFFNANITLCDCIL
ncbi:hypothetical protein EB796_017717 [Bugula neritina]|uniref:Uncharacterized protein n=1 Tax=Bugula neritina TaxID=10212 RepID=A0A7J7JEC8_BUGNE|nr:hypothetical protein EB796_017717 [Bugula neritina]